MGHPYWESTQPGAGNTFGPIGSPDCQEDPYDVHLGQVSLFSWMEDACP